MKQVESAWAYQLSMTPYQYISFLFPKYMTNPLQYLKYI